MTTQPRPHAQPLPIQTGEFEPDSNLTRFWTIAEVAAICRTSIRTARRWVRDGSLPVHRLGRRTLVSDTELQIFLQASRKS